MPESVLVLALGARVRIDLDGVSEPDAATIRAAWRDALVPAPVDTVAGGAARDEPVPTVVAALLGEGPVLLGALSQHVTLAALAQRRGELWMLHAAGVASAGGRVVVLVGPSGRGKTTAAVTLGTSFGYVSDETIAIDDEGVVWPYRKPLSVVEAAGAPKAQRSPSSLGLGGLPTSPLHLAAIVLLDRTDDGPEEATVDEVELGDALEELVAQSSYLTAMPAPLHSIAALAASVGGVRRVRYRDAPALVPLVHELLAEPARPSAGRPAGEAGSPPAGRAAGEAGSPPAGRAAGEAGSPPAGRAAGEAGVSRPLPPGGNPDGGPRYSRTPYVDALALSDPDRVAILRAGDAEGGMLHVLAGVAPAIWRAADAASVSDLTDAALAAYGAPESDASALVEAAIGVLVDAGVIVAERSWHIRDDAAWVGEGARVVVLGLGDATESPLALEGSAAAIWHALGERELLTTDAVIDRVAEIAGVERQAVEGDVGAFLESLASQGLIERI